MSKLVGEMAYFHFFSDTGFSHLADAYEIGLEEDLCAKKEFILEGLPRTV